MGKKKKGFTLVEMVAAMAMLTIILGGLASMVLTGYKQSAINSKLLDSNDISKSFFELVKNNRVEYPVGTYCIYFDNLVELRTSFDDFKDKNIVRNITLVSQNADYQIISSSNTLDKNIALKVKVIKNDNDKTFEFKTTSWNLKKGEFTEVDREYILAQSR